jgi:hypothetical protein
MITTQTKKWPLDFDALQKGTTVNATQCADIIYKIHGLIPQHRLYQVRLMELANRIEKELRERGRPVTTRIKAGAVEIVTDAQAVGLNGRRFKTGLRRSFRAHRRTVEVDARQLDSETARQHARQIEVQGKVLASVVSTRCKLALRVNERKTPLLASPEAPAQ